VGLFEPVAIVHFWLGCNTSCWYGHIWEGVWVVHTKFPMDWTAIGQSICGAPSARVASGSDLAAAVLAIYNAFRQSCF
jgi:hypothetical protein